MELLRSGTATMMWMDLMAVGSVCRLLSGTPQPACQDDLCAYLQHDQKKVEVLNIWWVSLPCLAEKRAWWYCLSASLVLRTKQWTEWRWSVEKESSVLPRQPRDGCWRIKLVLVEPNQLQSTKRFELLISTSAYSSFKGYSLISLKLAVAIFQFA